MTVFILPAVSSSRTVLLVTHLGLQRYRRRRCVYKHHAQPLSLWLIPQPRNEVYPHTASNATYKQQLAQLRNPVLHRRAPRQATCLQPRSHLHRWVTSVVATCRKPDQQQHASCSHKLRGLQHLAAGGRRCVTGWRMMLPLKRRRESRIHLPQNRASRTPHRSVCPAHAARQWTASFSRGV